MGYVVEQEEGNEVQNKLTEAKEATVAIQYMLSSRGLIKSPQNQGPKLFRSFL